MSVIAMKVARRDKHPNADTLHIYEMTAPGRDPVVIVGNSATVYEPDQVVAVALIGAVLKDGTHIRKARLRGINSFGMLIERVDEPVGAELSPRYARSPKASDEIKHEVIKWTSIELLHNVRRGLVAQPPYDSDRVLPTIAYRGKVKLDGTNGGIQILPSGEVVAQSRSRIITTDDDNLEFAAWVDSLREYFAGLAKPDQHMIIFGEWCGKGIQKRTAISKIDKRVFCVFAIQFGDHQSTDATIEVEPSRIRALLPEHPAIYVLPWYGEPIELVFSDRMVLARAADAINDMVASVEDCDPWVHDVFGVSGLGEGLVMYPAPDRDGPLERASYTWKMFKAKGEKHQVVKQKKPAQLDPEQARSIAHFVDLFVTPVRLEQAVSEGCGGAFEMKAIGGFLKWIGQDIKKESAAELEASGLEWKDVSKPAMAAARNWYVDKVRAL